MTALVLARSVARRLGWRVVCSLPALLGDGVLRLLSGALLSALVVDPPRHFARSRAPHRQSALARVLGFRFYRVQYPAGRAVRYGARECTRGVSLARNGAF